MISSILNGFYKFETKVDSINKPKPSTVIAN